MKRLAKYEIDIFNLRCLDLDALLVGIKPVDTISLEIRSLPASQHRYVISIIPNISKFSHLFWNPCCQSRARGHSLDLASLPLECIFAHEFHNFNNWLWPVLSQVESETFVLIRFRYVAEPLGLRGRIEFTGHLLLEISEEQGLIAEGRVFQNQPHLLLKSLLIRLVCNNIMKDLGLGLKDSVNNSWIRGHMNAITWVSYRIIQEIQLVNVYMSD